MKNKYFPYSALNRLCWLSNHSVVLALPASRSSNSLKGPDGLIVCTYGGSEVMLRAASCLLRCSDCPSRGPPCLPGVRTPHLPTSSVTLSPWQLGRFSGQLRVKKVFLINGAQPAAHSLLWHTPPIIFYYERTEERKFNIFLTHPNLW